MDIFVFTMLLSLLKGKGTDHHSVWVVTGLTFLRHSLLLDGGLLWGELGDILELMGPYGAISTSIPGLFMVYSTLSHGFC